MTEIVIVIVAAVGSAFFAAMQMSLRSASRGAIREIAARGGKSDRLDPILEYTQRYALAVSLPRVLCNTAIVGAVFFWVLDGAPADTGHLVTATIVSGAIVYLAGIVVPESLAEHAAEHIVVGWAGPLRGTEAALRWLVSPLRVVDVAVGRLVGTPELSDVEELEREIRSALTDGQEEGSIQGVQRGMIEALVDFGQRAVGEVMTPRTEIEGLERTDDLGAITAFIGAAGHSRIPIYDGNLDHIAGIVYAKDLLGYVGEDTAAFKLQAVLREARFIPETKPLTEALAEFQRDRVHLAIVLDEYGGAAGLVTIEDILEEIVGEIHDEHEPESDADPEIEPVPNLRAALIDARATIVDVNEALREMPAQLPEGEEYDTVGGYVLVRMNKIPTAGERFIDQENGVAVEVLAAEPTRVVRVRVAFDAAQEHGRAQSDPRETGTENNGNNGQQRHG